MFVRYLQTKSVFCSLFVNNENPNKMTRILACKEGKTGGIEKCGQDLKMRILCIISFEAAMSFSYQNIIIT